MLKFDPISKQYIDDGLPGDLTTPTPPVVDPLAAAPVIAPPTAIGSGGGTTINVPEGGSILPAPAAREVSFGTTRPIESKAEILNQGVVANAADAEVGAIRNQTGVEVKAEHNEEARLRAKAVRQELLKKELAEIEAKQEAQIAKRNQEEKDAVKAASDKAISAGSARTRFFAGNPLGEFVAAVAQAVAAGQYARDGKTGESPAERILRTRIDNYEKSLVTQWEAAKENRDLKFKDRPKFDAELAKVKVLAANRAESDIQILDNNFDAVAKGFGAEKAQAMGDIKAAAMEKANALTEQKRLEGLRTTQKFEETKRTPAAGSNDKPLTESEAKALTFGSTIVDASQAIGNGALSDDTIKALNSNIAMLQKGPPGGVIANWLKRADLSPAPDDFFTGIKDPAQKELARQWLNASNARMRYESGGAVTPIENLSDMMRNAPTVGDSPEKQRKLAVEQQRFGVSILPRKPAANEVRERGSSDPAEVKPRGEEKRPDGSEFTYKGDRYKMVNGKPDKVKQ